MVKHQGKKYDVEVDTSSTGEVFKFQLYSLTGVEPDRQKLIIKGKQLKDDTDMGSLGLKPNAQIMMMGAPSTGGSGVLVRPTDAIKFVEDMTEAEAARQLGATPSGLVNLGNTCYLNSTLQTLRSIPELQTELLKYKSARSTNSVMAALTNMDLTGSLRDLYKIMGETQGGLPPVAFLTALRAIFPQFAEKSKSGDGFAQQDAEEAWTQIVSHLQQRLILQDKPAGETSTEAQSFVDKYMSGEFITTLTCDDPAAIEAGETSVTTVERFYKLNCHIEKDTNHLRDGIFAALTEKLEKKSPALDRDATYTKSSKISRLPKYLTVHFVRFFWKREIQKKAKIMRKVTFPQELDVVEYCTDELKKALIPVRDKVREIKKEEEDFERARKKTKGRPVGEAGSSATAPSAPAANPAPTSGADGDTEMAEYKTDAQVEAARLASILAAKKELHGLIAPSLLGDDGANQSGLYELRGVVTHQGASADSGHYTAYVKKQPPVDPKTGEKGEEDGNWWWFNDDRVSEVPADKISTLVSGGESHSALILLYRAIPLPLADGTMAE